MVGHSLVSGCYITEKGVRHSSVLLHSDTAVQSDCELYVTKPGRKERGCLCYNDLINIEGLCLT